jgi:hypothetical protein
MLLSLFFKFLEKKKTFFEMGVSLCSPGWPGTHGLPALASQVPGITGMCHHAWLTIPFLSIRILLLINCFFIFKGGVSKGPSRECFVSQG